MPITYRIQTSDVPPSTIEFDPIDTILPGIPAGTISFTLGERIGQGAWGDVYDLTTTADIDQMVVKMGIMPNTARNRALLRNEVNKFKAIYGPRMAHLRMAHLSEKIHYFLLMKKIPGISLWEYIQSTELTDFEKLKILLAVLKKMHALHKQGYVHGDFHCKNIHILINPETGEYEIFFLDLLYTYSISGLATICIENCPYWTRDRVKNPIPPEASAYHDVFTFFRSLKDSPVAFNFKFIDEAISPIFNFKLDPIYILFLTARLAKIKAKKAEAKIHIEYYTALQSASADEVIREIKARLTMATRALQDAVQIKKEREAELSVLVENKNEEQKEKEARLAISITTDNLIKQIEDELFLQPELAPIREYCLLNLTDLISMGGSVYLKEILLERLPDQTELINSLSVELLDLIVRKCNDEVNDRLYSFLMINEPIFLSDRSLAALMIQLRSAEKYELVSSFISNYHIQKLKKIARIHLALKTALSNFSTESLKNDIEITLGLSKCSKNELELFLNCYFPDYPESTKQYLTEDILANIIDARLERYPAFKPFLLHYQNSSVEELVTLLLQLKKMLTFIKKDLGNPAIMENVNELMKWIPDFLAEKSMDERKAILHESLYHLYLLCSSLPTYESALLKATLKMIVPVPVLDIDPDYQFILEIESPAALCKTIIATFEEAHLGNGFFFRTVNKERYQAMNILKTLESLSLPTPIFASLFAATLVNYRKNLLATGRIDAFYEMILADARPAGVAAPVVAALA